MPAIRALLALFTIGMPPVRASWRPQDGMLRRMLNGWRCSISMAARFRRPRMHCGKPGQRIGLRRIPGRQIPQDLLPYRQVSGTIWGDSFPIRLLRVSGGLQRLTLVLPDGCMILPKLGVNNFMHHIMRVIMFVASVIGELNARIVAWIPPNKRNGPESVSGPYSFLL